MRTNTPLPSLSDNLKKAAQQPSIITRNLILSFQNLSHSIAQTSRKLQELGLQEGDQLAVLSHNSVEYVILLLALWNIGIVAVPLSVRWPKKLILKSLKNLNCKQLAVSEKLAQFDPSLDLKSYNLEEIVQQETGDINESENPKLTFNLNRKATILFTSGTSGNPKLVLHTLANHFFSAMGSNENIPVTPGDRWLLSLPLYHVGGLAIIYRILLGGGAVVIPEKTEALEAIIIGLEVTHLSLVSTQFLHLLQNKKMIEYLRALKAILLGGGAIPVDLIRKAVELKLPIFTSYGSTEMASQITTTRAGDSLQQLLTAGRPLKYRQLKIAEDQEILVGGETLFQGFLVNGSILKSRDKEGWYHSGDFGFLDKKGYLTVTGRKDNMLVSGGENIQPEEVERALRQMDNIEDAVVVPVINRKFGQRPVAFVKMRPDKKFKIKDFEDHLAKILPKFKIPDHFFPWPKNRLQKKGLKISREEFKRIAEKII